MPVYPQPNLDPNAAPWGRSVNTRLAALELAASRKDLNDINTNKQQNSTAVSLSDQVAVLLALANVQYAEMGAATNFSGYYTGAKASVNITSPTGRLEVGFGGSLNGGSGYFVYSIVESDSGSVVVDRDSVLNNPAQRVAVSGGSSFAPSGYKTIVRTVPVNRPLTVTLELNAQDSFVYFFGGSLLARVAP